MEYDNSDERLISMVRLHNNIYDRRCATFKNRQTREQTWRTIGNRINKPGLVCEQRWNVLRTRYALEKRKSREESRPSTWPLFSSMNFLDGFMQARRSYSSFNNSSNSVSPSCSSWDMNPAATPPQYVAPEQLQAHQQQQQLQQQQQPSQQDQQQQYQPKVEKDEEQSQFVSSYEEGESVISPEEPYNSSEMKHGGSFPAARIQTIHSNYHMDTTEYPEYAQQTDRNDVEYAFGRTVALMLKNINGGRKRRKVQADIMQLLATYDSGSDND